MKKATVLLFTSMTCPHCPPAKTVLEQFSQQRDDVDTHNLPTHSAEGQKLAQKFGIMSVPTFVVYGDGTEEVFACVGDVQIY